MLYTGKRKWQKLSIEDIEEKIEGYEEIKPGYDLVDTNEFTKQQLLEDNLVTSKAMLIEKSQNKEELYPISKKVGYNSSIKSVKFLIPFLPWLLQASRPSSLIGPL